MINKKQNNSGFSLIEVSIMIAVLGVISVALITSKAVENESVSLSETKNRIEEIKTALNVFYDKNFYLPCAASGDDLPNSPNFGKSTDCNAAAPSGVTDPAVPSAPYVSNDAIRIGVVPTRTLSLPDSYMMDKWGNRISYSVIKELAIDQASFDAYTTAVTTGVIQINDKYGVQITSSSIDDVNPYLLVSHGKDKKGSYSKKGTSIVSCGSVAVDSENCDDDYIFVSSEVDDMVAEANYYYDILAYLSKSELDVSGGGTPTPPSSILSAYSVGTGKYHTCALKNDGAAWCWGRNDQGQLGNNDRGTGSNVPAPVVDGHLWKALAEGDADYHTCALKTDDTAWCWGNNGRGELGDGTTSDSDVPVIVSGGYTWKSISLGDRQGCGIQSDDTAWCWGENNWGQLGDGGAIPGSDSSIPTAVVGGHLWKVLSVGGRDVDGILGGFVCGIKDDDTAWCWGRNYYGTSGDGNSYNNSPSTISSSTPIPVSGGHTWKSIASGEGHVCGIKSDDTAWCWGYNDRGQIGDGTKSYTVYISVPTLVSGSYTWKTISTAEHNTCGIQSDDTAWCWGYRHAGRLGDNQTSSQSTVPTPVVGGHTWTTLNSGYRHTCGINLSGDMYCWGSDSYDQLGDNGVNSGAHSAVPIAVYGGTTWNY